MRKNNKFCIPLIYYSEHFPRTIPPQPTDTIEDTVYTFALYPNPVTNTFFIQLENQDTGLVEVWMFNALGQKFNFDITISPSNQIVIDFSLFAKGVYVLYVNRNGIIRKEKLIKH